MAPRAYYNEVDAYAAEWIRNLIAAGLITAGDVDTRSIVDVQPSDLRGYDRCHFFAGIGVWDYALGLAGWPADRPVWTGSCPCQPFSTAGRRGGAADERHLWPAWCHLIAECGPSEVFGEQVASKDGLAWLDLVHADLDGFGYTFGAADLCAAGVGAPHIRQRIWFLAHAELSGSERHGSNSRSRPAAPGLRDGSSDRGGSSGLANAEGRRRAWAGSVLSPAGIASAAHNGGMGDTSGQGLSARECPELRGARWREEGRAAQQSGRSFWSDAEWLSCRDGKARPTQPGLFPLAHGAPARVGRLRAYGNAIVAPVAAAFIAACLDVLPDPQSLAAE